MPRPDDPLPVAPHVPLPVDPHGPLPVTGVLLAAGAGTRMGMPKALVRTTDGTPWLGSVSRALLDGGCASVVVVLGAAAGDARVLVPDLPSVRTVVAEHWAEGPGASLAAGLRVLDDGVVACVALVDLPTMPPTVVRRVTGASAGADVLRRAAFDGRPGHPVLVGPAHRGALVAAVTADPGDRVAGAWLRRAGVSAVDCADLWDGEDRDRPTPGPPVDQAADGSVAPVAECEPVRLVGRVHDPDAEHHPEDPP